MESGLTGAGPLRGVRVLDCSTMIAAPTTAATLADFGADVVKIERPGSGDHVRRYGARHDGIGLYAKALGRNKRSVALDLHHTEAQALLLRWLPSFDIFIENFRPGTLERWQLGPDRLLAAAPHLIVLRMTAFGQDGPYRDRAGFGTLAEAMTGIASVSGYDDRPPLLPAFPLADIMAGQAAAAAVCAAAGATAVTLVDSSAPALERAVFAADRNGLSARVETRRGDAFEVFSELATEGNVFDIVVCDPPPFVRSRKDLESGARAYRKLGRLAAQIVAPRGFLMFASCSHNMPADRFRAECATGIARAGRRASLIRESGAGPDHAVHPMLPETAYLKALLYAVE